MAPWQLAGLLKIQLECRDPETVAQHLGFWASRGILKICLEPPVQNLYLLRAPKTMAHAPVVLGHRRA